MQNNIFLMEFVLQICLGSEESECSIHHISTKSEFYDYHQRPTCMTFRCFPLPMFQIFPTKTISQRNFTVPTRTECNCVKMIRWTKWCESALKCAFECRWRDEKFWIYESQRHPKVFLTVLLTHFSLFPHLITTTTRTSKSMFFNIFARWGRRCHATKSVRVAAVGSNSSGITYENGSKRGSRKAASVPFSTKAGRVTEWMKKREDRALIKRWYDS